MQSICKYYKETQPSINVQVGDKLQVFRFRDALSKVKGIKNTRFENRKLNRFIRKLEDKEFIFRTNDVTFEVLDTGEDWFKQ